MPARPPFRADHVGSLLRPAELIDAHERNVDGKIDPAVLREIEERHIRAVVALQEGVGLHAVTDGEFRRMSFHFDFLNQLEGVKAPVLGRAPEPPPGAPKAAFTPPTLSIVGKVRHIRPIEADGFRFLKATTTRVAKQTIPSPTMLLRGERAALDAKIYPDRDAFYEDTAKAYRAEIRALADAGCSYLQLDDTNFAYLCDPAMRAGMTQRGDDPDELLRRYARVVNAAIAQRPAGMTICMHLCRGNMQSRWAASGGYEPVAEVMFNEVGIDGYFLEFDSERAGGFEPLRFLPKDKRAVLGLVSSKLERIETIDEIRRRIDDAAKFAPLDNLCLSPQCGFASSFRGNAVSVEVQRRKLAAVVEIATAVWGTAE